MKNYIPTNNLGEWDKFLERHKLPKELKKKENIWTDQQNNTRN